MTPYQKARPRYQEWMANPHQAPNFVRDMIDEDESETYIIDRIMAYYSHEFASQGDRKLKPVSNGFHRPWNAVEADD